MALTPEQKANIRRALRTAQGAGASRKQLKALVEAMGVESNYRHLNYGDRDSVGILQQRPSQGWGPAGESVGKDVRQFLAAAQKVNAKGMTAGQLAQAVQRSAFPERYDQRSGEAEQILRSFLGGGGPVTAGGGAQPTTETIPGVDRSKERVAALAGYFFNDRGKGDLLQLGTQLRDLKDTPAQTIQIPGTGGGGGGGGGRPGKKNTNIYELMDLAKNMGLNVGEFGVSSGHADNSYHYRKAAADISGDPALMRKFARLAARRYGKDLEELIWRGPGARTIDNGKRVPTNYFSGHKDHVHVADAD